MRSKVRWRGGLMGLKAYHVDNEEWIYNMSANLNVERNTLSYITDAAIRTICNKVRIYGFLTSKSSFVISSSRFGILDTPSCLHSGR